MILITSLHHHNNAHYITTIMQHCSIVALIYIHVTFNKGALFFGQWCKFVTVTQCVDDLLSVEAVTCRYEVVFCVMSDHHNTFLDLCYLSTCNTIYYCTLTLLIVTTLWPTFQQDKKPPKQQILDMSALDRVPKMKRV